MCAVPPDKRPPQPRACVFAWCSTVHGEAVHPDDEVHRSAGSGFSARVRDARGAGSGLPIDVEVGVVRRDDDTQAWVVLEFEGGPSIAIDPADVRTLGRILLDDRDLLAALDDRVGPGLAAVREQRAFPGRAG